MRKIHKYYLTDTPVRATSIRVSGLFSPLSTQVQDGVPVLWVETDPEVDQVEYEVRAAHTGQDVPGSGWYVGTVILGETAIHYYLEPVSRYLHTKEPTSVRT